MLNGTVGSGGVNGPKAPGGSVKELGFNAMTENASTNTVAPKGTTGYAEPLVSAIDVSADTMVTDVPEGTVTGGGING